MKAMIKQLQNRVEKAEAAARRSAEELRKRKDNESNRLLRESLARLYEAKQARHTDVMMPVRQIEPDGLPARQTDALPGRQFDVLPARQFENSATTVRQTDAKNVKKCKMQIDGETISQHKSELMNEIFSKVTAITSMKPSNIKTTTKSYGRDEHTFRESSDHAYT